MNKTLFTFGCSFTQGTGVWCPTNGFIKKIDHPWGSRYRDYHWGEQVSKALGYNFLNFGVGGASNETTLHVILDNFKLIKEQDIVIIGITQPSRLKTIHKNLWMGVDFNFGWLGYWRERVTKNGITEEEANENFKNMPNFHKIPKEELEAAFSYLENYIAPNQQAYRDYYKANLTNLANILVDKKARVVLWDDSFWKYFERICDWAPNFGVTSGMSTKDTHWSPNGSSSFAKLILWAIEQNQELLELNSVEFTHKLHYLDTFYSKMVKPYLQECVVDIV